MSRVRFEVVTRASPEQVWDALTDFTERRLQIWSQLIAHGWRKALDRYAASRLA